MTVKASHLYQFTNMTLSIKEYNMLRKYFNILVFASAN